MCGHPWNRELQVKAAEVFCLSDLGVDEALKPVGYFIFDDITLCLIHPLSAFTLPADFNPWACGIDDPTGRNIVASARLASMGTPFVAHSKEYGPVVYSPIISVASAENP